MNDVIVVTSVNHDMRTRHTMTSRNDVIEAVQRDIVTVSSHVHGGQYHDIGRTKPSKTGQVFLASWMAASECTRHQGGIVIKILLVLIPKIWDGVAEFEKNLQLPYRSWKHQIFTP